MLATVDLVRALTVRKQLYKIRHKIIAGVLVDAESQVEIELELMPQVIKILCDLGYTIGKTYKPGNKSTYILSWRPEEEESDDSSGSTASLLDNGRSCADVATSRSTWTPKPSTASCPTTCRASVPPVSKNTTHKQRSKHKVRTGQSGRTLSNKRE